MCLNLLDLYGAAAVRSLRDALTMDDANGDGDNIDKPPGSMHVCDSRRRGHWSGI